MPFKNFSSSSYSSWSSDSSSSSVSASSSYSNSKKIVMNKFESKCIFFNLLHLPFLRHHLLHVLILRNHHPTSLKMMFLFDFCSHRLKKATKLKYLKKIYQGIEYESIGCVAYQRFYLHWMSYLDCYKSFFHLLRS